MIKTDSEWHCKTQCTYNVETLIDKRCLLCNFYADVDLISHDMHYIPSSAQQKMNL